MDFISNLIKRPISLVLNDTSNTMDKYPISASLPNAPSVLEINKDLEIDTNKEQNGTIFRQENNKRPLSMSSSYSGDNMTDFIGVPEDFLDEFKDIFLPPPPILQNLNPLTESLLDMDNTDYISITPPPAPFPLQLDKAESMTPSMKVSQTIDELLLQINDNLQQAGLNDDVLAIASPSKKSELSPLSSKAALNNPKLFASSPSASKKQLNETKTSATAAGSASLMVIENKSQNKFNIGPGSETDDAEQHQQQNGHDEYAANEQLNISDVSETSNKFAGITEFDEAKIPELPGDLNPNIEEEYHITFEKCFVPTFKAQQGTTAPEQLKVNKTQVEVDAVSSDNETFVDCNDEKDPLATNCAETDVTTDLESFCSAANKSLTSDLNNTMDNIADITMEAEDQPLKYINQTHVAEQSESEHNQTQVEPMDEDEPMDVDMSTTIEIIHNTSNNIQHVEKVLQHAENILLHLDDKNPMEEGNTETVKDSNEIQTESPKTALVVNTPLENQQLDIEHSRHESDLNKTIELPINKSKSECIIESYTKDVPQEKNNDFEQANNMSDSDTNLRNESINSSTISSSSAKSSGDSKAEIKPNLTVSLSTSINSQESSAPSSPLFPIKSIQTSCFPRSPKAVAVKSIKSSFLEKSDYSANLETQAVDVQSALQSSDCNGSVVESASNTIANNVDVTKQVGENKRLTFGVSTSVIKSTEEQHANNTEFTNNKRQTFSVDTTSSEEKNVEEKRRTFSVGKTDEDSNLVVNVTEETTPNEELPKTELNSRRTFNTTSVLKETPKPTEQTDLNLRLTFNLPSVEFTPKSIEQTVLKPNNEPMERDDDHVSKNTTISMPANVEQISESSAMSSQMQQKTNSPPLPATQETLESSLLTKKSSSQSSPSVIMQPNTQPPPPQDMRPSTQSPALPNMQPVYQSPARPNIQPRSQSPCFSTIQPTSQLSPNHPIMTQNKPDVKSTSQPLPDSTHYEAIQIKEEEISPPTSESTSPPFTSQSLSQIIRKRPSIRDGRPLTAEVLSAKEQSNIKVKDEKDILTPTSNEDVSTGVSTTSTTLTNSSGFSEFDQNSSSGSSITNAGEQQSQQFEDEFNGNNNFILNPSDFDYLLTKGNNNILVDRSSLLLKFDPLLGIPVPSNQGPQQLQQLQIPTNTNSPCLTPPLEEDEHNGNSSFDVVDPNSGASAKLLQEKSKEDKLQTKLENQTQENKRKLPLETKKKNATMSVGVIKKDMSLDNDSNKTFEISNSTQSDGKQINYKMDELEKKIKNEVLKTDDIEKKLKDAEQREEALIKRITEKDKTITKMNGVIEAYEKAIAELIADKEQLTQQYEKQLAEVRTDRDSFYNHLTSLETTFSDLHVKYEKSKEMTCQLKESEEALQAEKRRILENLRLQEQRYDKMKNHAIQQLEIANKKLESLTRENVIEVTKLKALLKKEEIARSSINEQLAHKTRENAELVKICDELISGQGIS